jgi:hypothetical protein
MHSQPAPLHRGMVDPAGDDPAREWGYSPKSLTWIGVPFQPHWTQVTFDGALYSLGQVEVCFFHGQPLAPLLARQKHYYEGWIPIVEYSWRRDGVDYALEVFAAALEGEDETNTVNFVKVEMTNPGSAPATAGFAAALRHCGGDGRWLQWGSASAGFSPDWRYEMTDDAAIRDGRLVYAFTPGAAREAVPGEAYAAPFPGQRYHLTWRAEACLARYLRVLAPGDRQVVHVKMPRLPVAVEQLAFVRKLHRADHDTYRQQTIDYWRRFGDQGMQVEIPEARVQDAFRANLVHLALAHRDLEADPRWRFASGSLPAIRRCQTSGINYPDFFCNDYVDMRLAWDASGHSRWNAACIDATFAMCPGLGECEGAVPWPHWGQVLHSLAHHYLITGDVALGQRLFPHLRRGIEILRQALADDPHGLVPECGPYDNEMIQGHYTSHNLWCLLGLRSAVRLARRLGEDEAAAAWLALHDRYRGAVLRALEASVRDHGCVRPGLYDYRYGTQTRAGLPELVFHNEWENSCLVWPTEVLAPDDPWVTATLDKIHRCDFREGMLGYHNAYGGRPGDIHGYSGHSVIWQLIARGDQAQALTDLYHVLLHCGSTHEIWEQGALSWSDRESAEHTGPHTWASARTVLSIRNLLLMERGGDAGLAEGERDLHLFSVISPAWAHPGQEVAFRNAVTEMGHLSARLRFTAAGAEIELAAQFHRPPRWLVVHVPWFVALDSFTTDAAEARRDGDQLRLSPDARRVALRWHEKPGAHEGTYQNLLQALRAEPSFAVQEGTLVYVPPSPVVSTPEELQRGPEPLSFALVREVYQHEYTRRYADFVAAGGTPLAVAAPPLLTADERRERHRQEYGDGTEGGDATT